MKRCLHCEQAFSSAAWTCPSCGFRPMELGGVLSFAPDMERDGDGFDARDFEKLAASEAGNFWFSSRNRVVLWALERYFPQARTMLEIGCGTGFVLAGVRAARPQMALEGGDLFTQGLQYAHARLPGVPLYQLDARDLPFEEEFDLVCALDVLEHVDADDRAMGSMYRAIRPGGGALVTVPQHPSLWSSADVSAHHQRRYTRRELLGKLEAAGFAVRHVTSFVSSLLPLMAASRMVSRLRRGAYDPWAEFRRTQRIGPVLERVAALDLALMRRGASLPAGGSLLAVATRTHG
jgi:SAM-dependent methyltransferase